MRGRVAKQTQFFLTVNLESEIPADHPLRSIKKRADAILKDMRQDFDAAYSPLGRRSIPPEQLLKAMLLMALYSIRSEIQLMQQIHFNLLYRWFLDLGDVPAWTPEVFSMNRRRFEEYDLVRKFFDRVVAEAIAEDLAGREHFTVDGTLIRSWASMKSMTRRDGTERPGKSDDDPDKPMMDYGGGKVTNETHVSTTDPEARLMRKGKERSAYLSHSGHVLMDNLNGLVMDVRVGAADGHAERKCAGQMLKHVKRRHGIVPETLGADSAYDDAKFLEEMERRGIEPHVSLRDYGSGPKKESRRRAKERMATEAYAVSQRMRKRVEEIFGWCKTVGRLARSRLAGRWKITIEALMTAAAYNLVRLAKLKPA
jgi:transposase